MKLLLARFLVGVLVVPFIRGEQPRWRAGHSYPQPLPQEIMVDAVNYIGLVLLHAHNQNNENNIALSPYGATSVLVALGEGVQGTALNEILQATLLPLDVSVTRVGLRDIHRHLKSYFIPQEGFLAGLTFSHENVTLKHSYEDILRFYGYDVDSFNNALYPDPYSSTTNVGSESTTESLSSVSHSANFSSSSSSTTQTSQTTPTTTAVPSSIYTQAAPITPATVAVPSTIDNRDDFNDSESTPTATDPVGTTTIETTLIINEESTTVQTTQMSTTANEAIPESTVATTVATTTPSTITTAASTQTSSITTTVPVTTSTTQVPTTIPSESTVTSTITTVTPSTVAATTPQPTTFNSANIAGVTNTSSETASSIQTISTLDTPIQTTTATGSTILSTSASTTPLISTVITSQDITATPTSESTKPVTTTPVNVATTTTVPLTTTITQRTRPTAVTISVVPSTVGHGNRGSTSTSSTTSSRRSTQIQGTGPIVINLQPTTIASTSTATTVTERTATTKSISTITTVPSTIAISTRSAATKESISTITTVPSTIAISTGSTATEESTTGSTATEESISTITTVPSTIAISTGSTGTAEYIPTITTVPSTIAISTRDTATNTNTAPTTLFSSTLNPQSSTLNFNSEPTAFTVDLVPSTIGTGSSSSTTRKSIPTLITPPGGDLLGGFEIDVRPTTVASRSADIIMAESEKNIKMRASDAPKKKSLPRFRDDIELVKSLKSENNSAAMHKIAERSFGSQPSTSKNSFNIGKEPVVESNALFKNEKNIAIYALIGRTSAYSTTASTSGFVANTTDTDDNSDFDSGLYTESRSTAEPYSSTSEIEALNDKDVIIVNREDYTDDENADDIKSEIILSEEDMLPELSSLETHSTSTEGDVEEGKARGTRSVIDYLIARYHDNNNNPSNIYTSTSTEYEPVMPTTFAVNGKIRETNINFMTYDTVLPFRYISYLNALALTFPLDSTKYYLLLILPLDEMGIDNLISNMMSTTLKQIIYHLQPTRVKATIPSFMLKGYVVLTPTLQKLGIKKIFEPRHADFSRMTDDKDIYVTNIEQAVTVTIRNYIDPSTLQNNQHFRQRGPVQFTADHPFLYFVMDSQIHVALMAGKIINPLNSRIR